MKRLSNYQLENDLEFNCDLHTRRKAINTLSQFKTRAEQDEHIEFLKGIEVIIEEEEEEEEEKGFMRNERGFIF